MTEQESKIRAMLTGLNMDDLVGRYIQIRDRIKGEEDAFKAKMAQVREIKDMLEVELLLRLNSIGGDSVKTAHGTAYRTSRRSASLADGAAFREFVVAQNAFDLVDWRANAPAVDDFIKSQGAPPPGVNFSVSYTAGVRRA